MFKALQRLEEEADEAFAAIKVGFSVIKVDVMLSRFSGVEWSFHGLSLLIQLIGCT